MQHGHPWGSMPSALSSSDEQYVHHKSIGLVCGARLCIVVGALNLAIIAAILYTIACAWSLRICIPAPHLPSRQVCFPVACFSDPVERFFQSPAAPSKSGTGAPATPSSGTAVDVAGITRLVLTTLLAWIITNLTGYAIKRVHWHARCMWTLNTDYGSPS
jgi:hypothetical protein